MSETKVTQSLAADGVTPLCAVGYNLPLMVSAIEFNRLYSQNEDLRAQLAAASEHAKYCEQKMDEITRRHADACDSLTAANKQIEQYKRGNTILIESLMDMANQFFYHRGENGDPDEDGPILRHSFMSAEEGAIAALTEAGFVAEEVLPVSGYRLLWDKLTQRKKDVGLIQMTWEEAVRKHVTDPEEVERLLSLDNDATTEEIHAAVKGNLDNDAPQQKAD